MEGYYIGIDSYDWDSITKLCGCQEVKGVVFGDLLCTKRMFAGGIAEEIRLLCQLMESRKEILFQTPLYVTSRNYDEVFSILELLDQTNNQIHVITEDMGVACAVSEKYPSMKLVWGRMGRDRENWFTDDFLKELKAVGIHGMETEEISVAQRLRQLEIEPYFVYGNLQYQTVGRICYLKYQTGACRRKDCLEGSYKMKEKDGPFEMSIDGYLMGVKFHYGKAEEMAGLVREGLARITIYGHTFEEVKSRGDIWRKR